MRLVTLAFSPVILLSLTSCTIENTRSASDAAISGGSNAMGGTGGVASSSRAGGGTSAGNTVVAGGSSAAAAGNAATGGSSAAGGTATASSSASLGGNSSVSSSETAGGSTAVGGATATVGGNSATAGASSLAATGGNATVGGNSATTGGSSSVATGGSSSAATGGNATVGGNSATTGGAGGGTGLPKALPLSTFVFERKIASGRDHLVAMDFVTGEQRIITTLADGSVEGWNIDGATVSPDRTRIVIASLFGPTSEDNATGLATNRLWSLDTNGQDFRRLTPVFPNTHAGQTGWRIDVRDPAYSADGQVIVFDYGEGDSQSGYVAPWVIASDGSTLPSLFETSLDCSVNNNAAFNPATGDMLLEHAACIGGSTAGFYLYPIGGGPPDYLVNDNGVTISGEPPAFSADGAVFVFTARAYSDNIQSLYAYIMGERRVVTLLPGAMGIDIVNATFAPDNVHLVYCIRQGDAYDLRLLDFAADPPTDSPLTTDGISCDAVF